MKREDIEFLRDLQAKLIKADEDSNMNDSQANPRFWVVMQKELVEDEYGGEPYITDDDTIPLDDYIDIVNEEVEDCDDKAIQDKWSDVNKSDAKDVSDFANSCLDRMTGVIYLVEKDVIAQNTMFLTKEAAQLHIKQNGYHYKHPRTFAMTAWRSPEVERFLKLFKELEIDNIKEDESETNQCKIVQNDTK